MPEIADDAEGEACPGCGEYNELSYWCATTGEFVCEACAPEEAE